MVTGRMVKEREEILAVAESVAAADLTGCQREASVHEGMLEAARAKVVLWKDMRRAFDGMSAAAERVRSSAGELEARRAELR